MKVMLENSLFHPNWIGGAETVTLLLARELSARGVEVDVLATTGRRDAPPRLATRTVDGVSGTVYEAPPAGLYDLLPAPGRPSPGLPVRAAHHLLNAGSPRWERWAAEALRRSRPDVLHTNTIVGLTPVVWRAARRQGVPVVHTLHDYHLLCARTTLLRSDGRLCDRAPWPCRELWRWKRRATADVDVVTAPSRFVLQRHLDAGGFAAARAEIVRNAPEPAPPEALAARRRRWAAAEAAGAGGMGNVSDAAGAEAAGGKGNAAGAAGGAGNAPETATAGLFLGQLNAHKGIPQLLGALDLLRADGDLPAWRFAFAGAGPLAEEVARYCAASGGRCEYLGTVAGAAREAAWARGDWLVLPSRWHDVAPLTILEAYARGVPVVGAHRGGITELVENERTGLLYEPEPAAIAAALARYIRDPALARRHGAAAAATADQYTRERQVESFLEIYEELAQRASPLASR